MLKPSIIKLCGEITALSVFISSVTKDDAFVDYASHVHHFTSRIVPGGWKEDGNAECETRKTIYLRDEDSEQQLISLKNKLEDMLKSKYSIDSNVLPNSTI